MKDGTVYFGADKTLPDSLTSKVKDRLTNRTSKEVYVKADARARYGKVVEVVDAVRAAGVDDLGLLTDQKKDTPKPPSTPTPGQ
jgi:biopolymer transport protein ExbD